MPHETHSERQRIVPDGCFEMIFHLGDSYRQYLSEGISIVQPKCFVFGQITQPLEIEPIGKTDIFAVRFHPEGFAPLMKKPHDELENLATPLSNLFGEEGIQLETDVINAETSEERIEILGNFLTACLNSPKARYIIDKSCVETILALDGNPTVGELANQLKIIGGN